MGLISQPLTDDRFISTPGALKLAGAALLGQPHCTSHSLQVASGEHGTFTEKLVTAVQNGKCQNLSEGSPGMIGKAGVTDSVTNDITKTEGGGDGGRIYLAKLDHHIVSSKKFLRTSSSPHKTLPNDKYNAPKEVCGERKLFYRPLKK